MSRLQILLAALLFGTTGTAQALGPDAPSLLVGSARIAVGGALLVLAALALGELRSLRSVPVGVALAGGVGVAVYQLAFFAAVRDTGVAVGTVVAIGSAPVAAGALEWALHGVRPSARWLAATALAGAGVAVLLLAAGDDASLSPLGVGLALLAALGYAAYAVLSRGLLRRGHGPTGVMAVCFGAGAVLLAPVLAFDHPAALASPSGIALAAYLGVLPTAVAYLLYARGLRSVTAAEATTIGLAEPVTATALGVAVLGERLQPLAGVGAALVLAALVLLAVPARLRACAPARAAVRRP